MSSKTAKLNYLTVQDVLWINLQLTGKVHHYNFAKLEEATFYQYSYGTSTDVLNQAARFYCGFSRLKPLEAGNEATALIGLISFLEANGYDFLPSDQQALKKLGEEPAQDSVLEVLKKETAKAHHEHESPLRSIIEGVLDRYPKSASKLVSA